MNGINPKDIVITLLAFLLVSLLAKFMLLASLANLIASFFPAESSTPIYLSLILAILFTGLAIGKLINARIEINPMVHALVIAGLAGAYKVLRPDFDPLPYLQVGLFSLLNFSAILVGAHVTASK